MTSDTTALFLADEARAKKEALFIWREHYGAPTWYHKGNFTDYSEKSLEYNDAIKERNGRCFIPKSQVFIGDNYVLVPDWIHEKLRQSSSY
jgi:hypothetical protein